MNYHDITKDDMKNGPGLRAVLWVSGCEHHCPGCQNPITWDPGDGLKFDDEAHEELMELLGRDYISGLTLSGGDPLYPGNRDSILELCREVKDRWPDKTIWIYTGYDYEDIASLDIMKYTDVVVDGKYIEDKRDILLHWRGSSNQRVIDVNRSQKEGVICTLEDINVKE
ncbi:MAG: anaerobic ribonucleoside-triphosphate reductase activating protein [Lachnospiraceae bacterium]|nr:anaerobic ribonucleoside-triphosphate reductase activating protein [Lachnospiraceae bacterium]